MTPDPCKICGSPVHLEQRKGPQHGTQPAPTFEARVCDSRTCSSNTSARRLSDVV